MSAVARKQLPLRPAGEDTVTALLDWYDRERRHLPWRAAPSRHADPYRVWLSEVMLQQTTVKAVVPYFAKFVKLWPTVGHLARADLSEVLAAWAGLGYYSRARNLHACAIAIVEQHGGRFPRAEAALRELPGIGPYTAAAIAAIAFGEQATPVDGNVERVISRLFAVRKPLPSSKTELRRLASTLTPVHRAGDFAQALMDLGATICTPKSPSCLMCPLQSDCHANAKGLQPQLPAKGVRRERPLREGFAFLAVREDGAVLLRRRPATGLLASMMEIPSTEWLAAMPPVEAALAAAPVRAEWWLTPGIVKHVFTHFRLELTVLRAIVPVDAQLTFWASPDQCRWVNRRALDAEALPSVMRKVIAHGLHEILNRHTVRQGAAACPRPE